MLISVFISIFAYKLYVLFINKMFNFLYIFISLYINYAIKYLINFKNKGFLKPTIFKMINFV